MEAQIIFSLGKIEEKSKILAKVAKQYQVNVLVAVKAANHILGKIQGYLQGFDVSNSREFALTDGKGFYFITNCPLDDLDFVKLLQNNHYLISCNSIYYFQEISKKNLPFVLRLQSTDLLGNAQTPGSRFGLTKNQVLGLKEQLQKNCNFSGFHFHHGSEKNSIVTYQAAITAIKELLRELGIKKELNINLGGGFAGLTITEIEVILNHARQELSEHKVYIEPGRYFTEGTGSCFCQVIDMQEEKDNLIINLNVSRECHLKWSRIGKIQILAASKSSYKRSSRRMIFYGNTCYENDIIGISHFEKDSEIGIGDTVVLSNISGYSLAWNTPFNGIPKINFELK